MDRIPILKRLPKSLRYDASPVGAVRERPLQRLQTQSIFLIFLILVSACAKTPPRTALDASQSAPLQQELDALARSRAQISTISAFVQVKLRGGGRSELFDAALLARSPDKLFLQILDDLGQERARFVADGNRVLFFDAQENQYRQIPQDGEALKKTLKLPLSVEELIDRLLRRLPEDPLAQWQKSAPGDAEAAYWARRKNDRLGLTQTPLGLAVYESLNTSGKWNYRVLYQGDEMLWSFRRPKITLSLNFQNPEFGKNLNDTRFDTQPPPGADPARD